MRMRTTFGLPLALGLACAATSENIEATLNAIISSLLKSRRSIRIFPDLLIRFVLARQQPNALVQLQADKWQASPDASSVRPDVAANIPSAATIGPQASSTTVLKTAPF